MSYEQFALILFFALVFVLLIPMISTRNGSSFFGSLKRRNHAGSQISDAKKANEVPLHSNGNQSELLGFMASLLRSAQKNGFQLVCPGTLVYGNREVPLSALLVGPSGVIGVHCLGYGGYVTSASASGGWEQSLNGVSKAIPDYFQLCREKTENGRAILDAIGMDGIRFEVVEVFTNKQVQLDLPPNTLCYGADTFLNQRLTADRQNSSEIDIRQVARKLAEVTRKAEKKQSKKAK